MKHLWFEDHGDLACDVDFKFNYLREFDEFDDVAIIAKYEDARHIIGELICLGYVLRSIDIHNDYDAEYLISISNIEGEDEIWCEPMLKENGYLAEESPMIFVLDNCSSKVIPYCRGRLVYEVSIGEDDCCECNECRECACKDKNNEIAIEKDGDMHGFSVNRSGENYWNSYSFYSTDLNLVNEMANYFR